MILSSLLCSLFILLPKQACIQFVHFCVIDMIIILYIFVWHSIGKKAKWAGYKRAWNKSWKLVSWKIVLSLKVGFKTGHFAKWVVQENLDVSKMGWLACWAQKSSPTKMGRTELKMKHKIRLLHGLGDMGFYLSLLRILILLKVGLKIYYFAKWVV